MICWLSLLWGVRLCCRRDSMRRCVLGWIACLLTSKAVARLVKRFGGGLEKGKRWQEPCWRLANGGGHAGAEGMGL